MVKICLEFMHAIFQIFLVEIVVRKRNFIRKQVKFPRNISQKQQKKNIVSTNSLKFKCPKKYEIRSSISSKVDDRHKHQVRLLSVK